MLTDKQILNKIKLKEIEITGFKQENLSPCSYNLCADSIIYKMNNEGIIDIKDQNTYPVYDEINYDNGYILSPGEFILIKTYEKIKLNYNYSGFLTLPSGIARLGINFTNSNLISPGFGFVNPKSIVIEISNISNNKIKIFPYFRICHLILFELDEKSNLNYDIDINRHSNISVNSNYYKKWRNQL